MTILFAAFVFLAVALPIQAYLEKTQERWR